MKNFAFVMDMNDEIGNLSEVNCSNLKWESYEFEEIEGENFIVGKGVPEFLETEKDLQLNDFEVLTSLLNLVTGPLPERFDVPFPEHNHLHTVISDNDIMSWVKQYGIPYKDKKLNEMYEDKQWRLNLIHLDSFRHRVAALFARFSIWKAIIEDTPQEIERYIMSLLTITPGKWAEIKQNADTFLPVVKKALAQEIGAAAHIAMTLKYDEKTEQNIFTLSTDSLLNVAYYQLAALLTKPYAESQKHLKNCIMCNNVFWADHGNDKFCSNPKCNKRNYWYHQNKKQKRHGSS